MTRIEEALRKIEQERRSLSDSRSSLRRPGEPTSSVLAPFTLNTQHKIKLDPVPLKHWGPVAMLDGETRAKKEYGQIKRPIINLALGRTGSVVPTGNVVVVSSALAGEGKSLTTLNLALSIAREKDLSVLLVDADMAKPDLSRTLGLGHARGLADFVGDETLQLSDVLWQTSVASLYFMPAGRERAGAAELFGSQRMKRIIDAFAQQLPRTIVIFDSSPLLLTNESQVLVAIAGQTILVVRANETPRQVVAEALATLDATKPVGLILNGARPDSASYYGGVYGNDSTDAEAAANERASHAASAPSPAR